MRCDPLLNFFLIYDGKLTCLSHDLRVGLRHLIGHVTVDVKRCPCIRMLQQFLLDGNEPLVRRGCRRPDFRQPNASPQTKFNGLNATCAVLSETAISVGISVEPV